MGTQREAERMLCEPWLRSVLLRRLLRYGRRDVRQYNILYDSVSIDHSTWSNLRRISTLTFLMCRQSLCKPGRKGLKSLLAETSLTCLAPLRRSKNEQAAIKIVEGILF